MKTAKHSPAVAFVALALISHQAHAQTHATTGVAEIQARHDRAFINELATYLQKNPKALDRDQAYAALFNKAIEHDWFDDVDGLAAAYLKSDPDGPVKALAQIIQTMARADAGQFDLALVRFKELMQGLGQDDQEEFAVSFAENLAATAVAAGDVATARAVHTALVARFANNPNLRQKVQAELKRLDTVGKPAPAFAVADLNGSPVRLASYRGKYVLVDFWATWCSPCIAELPRLQAAYRAYHDAGFEIIGISLDEHKAAVTDFVKARNIPWPQIHNGSGGSDLVDSFGVITIPALYLIDPRGTIVRLDLRGKALDDVLGRIFKRPAQPQTARDNAAAGGAVR